ncbi:tRNA1(Val) (adenine(37)-N6)-methyltransferase [Spirosoma radiotolerans]|uniref:tRNA1(Val) (adenine(37)-N6)-methyltransferase n=1 Tax=Spirosoma radiotolerans TaxID=1379870 RepID=A0A0E3ZTQ6_9BACT|nr:methyltransferase [Spirosoma radiotolerans]AKD55155.1 methyltransferase [Spirosoma radiotolerans]
MFRFKQFIIQQDRTAMKVCTDACVLGAYADVTGSQPAGQVKRILDIGTGTGLLALMAAQRNQTAQIDAVEVDEAAVGQAQENVVASPFAERVHMWHGRIQDFRPTNRYDRILTNPPFYTNHLRSPDSAVNRALHTDELSFPELIEAVVRLMEPDGQWWVLLPPFEAEKLALLANQAGLHAFKQLLVRHNGQKPVFRVITGFSFEERDLHEASLMLYEPGKPDGFSENRSVETYTSEFRTLLREFYLIF